jgi:hypothetical protein
MWYVNSILTVFKLYRLVGFMRLGKIVGRVGHIYPIRRRVGHIYPLRREGFSGCKGEVKDQ